jgi:F-type H+-transporting ATPase subunit gamma
MASIESLKKRIHTTEDLQSVVKSMRVLAALNLRQYEQTVLSQDQYLQTIERGLQILLKMKPGNDVLARQAPGGRLGAIVFGSDQGLCGSFNEQIALYALNNMKAFRNQPNERGILAIGLRVTRQLEDAGQQIEECLPTPSSRAGITVMAQDILVKIETWQREQDFDRIILYYHALLPEKGVTPHMRKLLPIDREWLQRLEETPWPVRSLPIFTMNWDQLFSQLIHHYLFISLSKAFAESLASENASRLLAMQGAERNIAEHREELLGDFQEQRQSSITEELLDIIGGFEVLRQSPE